MDAEEELKILEEQQKEKKGEDEEEEDEEEINNYCINDKQLNIQIKLFETSKEEYLVRFMKTSGEKADFYNNLDYMYYFAKNILN